MPSRNTIEIVIEGKDQASKVLNDVNKSLDTLGKVSLGVTVGGVTAATSAITGFGIEALAEFSTFQKGMAEVFTLIPDASAEMTKQLEDDVLRIGAQFGFLSETTIPAVYQAISSGVPPENMFEFISTASKAAIGGVTDLETAVNGITSVVNAYGAEVINAERASDIMFTGIRLGKTTFAELSNSLFQLLPALNNLGISFEQGVAAIDSLTAIGVPTSVATNQIRAMLVELQKPTTEVSKLFQEMAGKSFPQFIQEGGNLAAALGLIEQGAKQSGKDLSEVFGSVEALNAFLSLSGPNMERFVGFLEEMGMSAGATQKAFETMSKTLSFQVDRVRAKFSNLLKNVGRQIEPFAVKIVEGIGDALSVLDDFLSGDMSEGGDFTGFAKILFDALKTVKPVFDELKRLISGFFGALQAGIPFIDTLRVYINAILPPEMLQPFDDFLTLIGQISNAIGQAITPIIEWVKNNIELKDVLIVIAGAIATVVVPAIVGLIGAIASFAAPIIAIIGAVALLRKAWETDFGGIRTFITEKVMPALAQIYDWFVNTALPEIVNFIQTQAIPFFERIGTTISQIWTLIQPTLTNIANWFLNEALPAIVNFIRDNVIPIISDWVGIISGIWETVGSALGQFLEWFTITGLPIAMDWINQAWDTVQMLIDILSALWTSVQPALNDLKTGIQNIFGWIKDNIIQPVIDRFNEFASTVTDILTKLGIVQSEAIKTQTALAGVSYNPSSAVNNSAQLFGRANGLEYVPRNMNVRVHQGEAILTAEQNANRMSGSTTNNFTIQIKAPMTQKEADDTTQNMLNALKKKGIELNR